MSLSVDQQLGIVRIVMDNALPLVAFSIPIIAFLLSQMFGKKNYPREALPYKVSLILLISFLLLGTSVSSLSFAILVDFIPIHQNIYLAVVYSFTIMLVAIPAIVAASALFMLIRG